VSGEEVLVLVEEAVRPNDLNAGDLRDRARRAEESAREAEDGSEEQRRCQRDQRRAEAFLKIAESGGGR
jgi:F0F1-type ATP synthase epsilon subunit